MYEIHGARLWYSVSQEDSGQPGPASCVAIGTAAVIIRDGSLFLYSGVYFIDTIREEHKIGSVVVIVGESRPSSSAYIDKATLTGRDVE